MIDRAPRLATALTLAIGVLVAVPALAAADNSGSGLTHQSSPATSPTRVLARRTTGRDAITALGDNLVTAARRSGLSTAKMTSILRHDHTAWVSQEGRLFYKEDAPAETTAASDSAATPAPTYSASQTWTLHSHPSSTRKIFLDFDGATVQDTAWNQPGSGQITNATHIGYDTDGDPSTFSASELGFIEEVWREVSESYAPFDVDVTTQDPGLAGITRSSSSDTTYGTQVVITSSPTPRAQVCGGCLGVAYIGTFDHVSSSAYYQPAWVFAYDKRFDPMIVAQAATHETGHTLGLSHDGTASADYFAGTAAWGPIMGSSRNRAVSQFSIGEYAGANNHEDDFAVIAAHGLPFRADDHGSSIQAGDALGAKSSYDVNGIIGSRTDTDVFAINLPCVTDLSVAATGIGAQTALDLELDVLNSAGAVVASSAPAATRSNGSVPVSGGMDAQTTVPSATGAYFLRVDGVGDGKPAESGWSDYGSVGQYHLTASGCPAQPASTDPGPTGGPTPTPTPTPTPAPPTADPPTNSTPTQRTRPGAPVIRSGSSGTKGGRVTAVARWSPPASSGGTSVTKYRVRAQKLDSHHRVTHTYVSAYLKPTVRSLTMRLAKGHYVFAVTAWNAVGRSTWSHSSHGVYAR